MSHFSTQDILGCLQLTLPDNIIINPGGMLLMRSMDELDLKQFHFLKKGQHLTPHLFQSCYQPPSSLLFLKHPEMIHKRSTIGCAEVICFQVVCSTFVLECFEKQPMYIMIFKQTKHCIFLQQSIRRNLPYVNAYRFFLAVSKSRCSVPHSLHVHGQNVLQ